MINSQIREPWQLLQLETANGDLGHYEAILPLLSKRLIPRVVSLLVAMSTAFRKGNSSVQGSTYGPHHDI